MRVPVIVLAILVQLSQANGWDCIHGHSTIKDERMHLATDSLVVIRSTVERRVLIKGRMRLLSDTGSPQARMAVVFWRTEPEWKHGRCVEFAITRTRTCIQLVDYETGKQEVLEDAPYGFRPKEWVPFTVAFVRSGGKDICRVKLHIRNTRVNLKHTMKATEPIVAFGILSFQCEMELANVETEGE